MVLSSKPPCTERSAASGQIIVCRGQGGEWKGAQRLKLSFSRQSDTTHPSPSPSFTLPPRRLCESDDAYNQGMCVCGGGGGGGACR